MKTRAILQTSPFKTRVRLTTRPFQTRDGAWVGYACGEVDGRMTTMHVDFNGIPLGLEDGDTITVEKHGSEWRAV